MFTTLIPTIIMVLQLYTSTKDNWHISLYELVFLTYFISSKEPKCILMVIWVRFVKTEKNIEISSDDLIIISTIITDCLACVHDLYFNMELA